MLQDIRALTSAALTRALPRGLLAAVLLSQNACVFMATGAGVGGMVGAAAASPNTDVQAPAAVEVRFRAPRQLDITGSSGRPDTTYSDVIAVLGRVRDVSGDTVWVVASEIRFRSSRISFSRSGSPTAVVVRRESTSVRTLRSDFGSVVIGAGIGAAIGAALGYALLLALLSGAST